MKEITKNEIAHCITQALEEGTRNILFLGSGSLRNEWISKWVESHPGYRIVRHTPQPLYEEKNGILVQNPERFGIPDDRLIKANDEHTIWFFNGFSEQGLFDFDGVLEIIKSRTYTQTLDDGVAKTYTLEKMPLVIAYATAQEEFILPLDPQYYNLFDAVYLLK